MTPKLRLRSVSWSNSASRSQAWLKRLQAEDTREAAASDLYSGDHWSVLRELGADPSMKIHLSVASAGYGLVGPQDRLKPYSATFAPHHPDSVAAAPGPRAKVLQAWWRELSAWAGPGHGPRTLMQLASENPRTAMVVVASEAYLIAMEPDLHRAREVLANPDLLILCSVGAKFDTWMSAHQPVVDSRLSCAVGGAAVSLNARLARLIIKGRDLHGFHRAEVAAYLESALAGKPVRTRLTRTKITDDEISGFIKDLKTRVPKISASTALRALREAGWACEQFRFGQLFSGMSRGLT